MERTASSSKGQNRSRTRGKTSSIPTEEAGFLARAKVVFKSENPFFTVVMHPSHIGPGTRLFALSKFFEEYFTDQCGDIVLQLPDVGVWTVKYLVRYRGNRKRAVFQSGSWNSFTNDNSLRVGDVCVFELEECCTEPRLNVTNFLASQDGHSHGNTGDQWKISLAAALEAANTFISNQPFFKTAVTTACLKCCQVAIPVPFWNHMKKGTHKMKLQPNLLVSTKCTCIFLGNLPH